MPGFMLRHPQLLGHFPGTLPCQGRIINGGGKWELERGIQFTNIGINNKIIFITNQRNQEYMLIEKKKEVLVSLHFNK